MAKGQAITPEIENLIASLYEKHHGKWKAPRVRSEVEFILRKADETIPQGFPSLSKVQKVLATVRGSLRNPNKLDKPWSISTGVAAGIEIPTEALPFVLATWVFMKDAWDYDLTVREARWLGRLHGVARAILINLGPDASIEARSDAMGPFLRLVCLYAADERIAELTGKRDTSVSLDFILWKLATGITTERPELTEKIFPDKQRRLFQTEKGWLFKITKKDQAYMRKVWKQLGFSLVDFNEVNQRLSISFEVDESPAKQKTRKEGTK
jgi:hypothetical protein